MIFFMLLTTSFDIVCQTQEHAQTVLRGLNHITGRKRPKIHFTKTTQQIYQWTSLHF